MISREDVKHIAKLARIELDEKEVEEYQHDLAAILEYFKIVESTDVKGVEPMMHSISLENVVREDVSTKPDSKQVEELIRDAPERKGAYFKIRSILE